MSDYFKTMRRLKEDQGNEAAPQARLVPTAPEGPVPTAPAARTLSLPQEEAAHAELLDGLRVMVGNSDVPAVAIGAVSRNESSTPVIDGLLTQAQARGVRLAVVRLESVGSRRLVVTHGASGEMAQSVLELDLADGNGGVTDWLRRVCQGQDLVAVETPPILASAEALQIAKSCAGLAVVVHASKTVGDQLLTAVRRATSAGVAVLGLVMTGQSQLLPDSIRHLVERTSRV